jgi:uncharacterized protein (TIGR02246 family)
MKNIKIFTKTLSCLVFSGLLLTGCMQGPMDASNEIKEANKTFMEAFNNGDAKAMAMLYTENGKLYPSNSDIIEGREAIEMYWQGGMNMGIRKVMLETVSAEKYGSVAIEEGRYTSYLEGDQVLDQGKYIVTWKKEDGKWKLDLDIWNTSKPAPAPRAALNDTVWVIWNNIKADKVAQFEDFNFNYLEPAAAEFYPNMRNTVRTLRPVEKNKDGTYTYFYLMDPATSLEGYDMILPLTAKYGEEKASEYLKTFRDCLKDGKQEWVLTIQTEW